MKWTPLVLAALLAGSAGAQPVLFDPSLEVDTVVTGLALPTTMAFLGPNEFLVLEKNTGRVRRVLNGTIQAPDPVLDVDVNFASERGMLGIAISQDSPPEVFLYYTERSGGDSNASPDANLLGNRVYRYAWNSGTGLLEAAVLILDLPVLPGANHNAGVLTLDDATPQTLYVMTGDLNRSGQLQNQAITAPGPDDSSVILRVDRDGDPVAGNPLSPYCSHNAAMTCGADGDCGVGNTCFTQVARYFAYGIRNGFGMAFDPVTDDLWDTENGPGGPAFDEVNRVAPGFNSGWRDEMGPAVGGTSGGGDGLPLFVIPGSAYSDPEFSWRNAVAPTAIVFPALGDLGPLNDDAALVGDVNNGFLYRFPLNDVRNAFDLGAFAPLADLVADDAGERDLLRLGSGFGGITDLEMGSDGALYVVSIFSGAVYRIHRPGRAFFTLTPCRVADTRNPPGPLGGPALAHGIERAFILAGQCGIPASAKAVSVNLTLTQPSASGHVTLFPGNFAALATSTVNFGAGQTRANNAVLSLATDGDGDVRALLAAPGGTVHLILDVNGYFE